MEKIDFTIREFDRKYEDQLIGLVGAELRSWKVIPESDEPLDDADLRQIPEIFTGRGRFWVALIDEKVIGSVGVKELDATTAKLSRMFVFDKYHGTGVGQALINTAFGFAEKNGYRKILLNSDQKLTRSHSFYKRNGFVQTGEDNGRIHFEKLLGLGEHLKSEGTQA